MTAAFATPAVRTTPAASGRAIPRAPRATLLAAALACAAPAAALNDALPTEDQIRIVEQPGSGQPGKTFTATTLIAAPVPKLCGMVQDYAAYASYMPNTKGALPVGAGDGYVLVDMTLDLPLGQEKRYRLRLESEATMAQCKLSWKLIPRADLKQSDTIADTTGYWLFKPAPGAAEKSVVEYHVYADPGPVPFGFGWIVDMMSKRSLPRTLEALRARAAQ
jgi:hypothetical protein